MIKEISYLYYKIEKEYTNLIDEINTLI